MEGQLPPAVSKLLDRARAEGFNLGKSETLAVVHKYNTEIGRSLCEDGNEGLRYAAELRADLCRGHDAGDIANAALIMMESYAKTVVERGLSMSDASHLPRA